MNRRRFMTDWKMVAGFGGLLFLIVAIGLIGIQQIQEFSKTIGYLAKTTMPMQDAVLEMKSANSKYAMAVRSYMFWRSAKYLESAPTGQQLDRLRKLTEDFDNHLLFYASRARSVSQQQWIKNLQASEDQLRKIGGDIITSINRMDGVTPEVRRQLEATITRRLMEFENKLFEIDAFLEDPLQRHNLLEIERQLAEAEASRRRSIGFLSWSLVIGLGLGAQTAFLIYRRNKREKEHRDVLCRTVIRVEEEERNNLSLQIHDQMGQDLSALKIFLGLIDRDLPAEHLDQKEKIEKTKKILDGLMEKSHNISVLLRPPEIDELGLVESVSALILHYQEMTGMNFRFLKPSQENKLSPEYSLALYRVVQEALTNVAKYSKAKNVELSLQNWDDAVYLTISDDGVGFDLEEYGGKPMRRREDKVKLGLAGLRQRIELFGGTLTITTRPGGGTKLAVMLPT
ncbi:MAG: sensor histidine kinase [Candidatus Omnitrophota bacterium]